MKTIKLLAIIILALSCVRVDAQGFLKEFYDSFPETQVPYPVDSLSRPRILGWGHRDNAIPFILENLKIYDNFCLDHTTNFSISKELNDLSFFGKFSIPNSEYSMILFDALNVEYGSKGLFLSDKYGNKVDYLECESGYGYMDVRQFFIDSNYDITVYTLVPDSGDMMMTGMYEDGASITAHREDKKYRVINGRFTLINTIIYQSQTYEGRLLNSAPSYHLRYRIRNGKETVVHIQ